MDRLIFSYLLSFVFLLFTFMFHFVIFLCSLSLTQIQLLKLGSILSRYSRKAVNDCQSYRQCRTLQVIADVSNEKKNFHIIKLTYRMDS